MSRSRRDDERRGQRMDAALKGYLVKRMKQLEAESRNKSNQSDEDNYVSVKSEIRGRDKQDDGIGTPSSLSESENETRNKKKRKHAETVPRDDLPTSLSDSDHDRKSKKKKKKRKREKSYERNDLKITIHRGSSREKDRSFDLEDMEENSHRDNRSDLKSSKTDNSHVKDDRRDSKGRSQSFRSRSRSRSRDRRSESRSRSPESKRKSKKSGKDKSKKKSKKEKKRKKDKKDKDDKKRKKKRRLSDEDENAELDENGERIDYDFEEPDPEEFAEDGEVSEEETSDEEDGQKSDINEESDRGGVVEDVRKHSCDNQEDTNDEDGDVGKVNVQSEDDRVTTNNSADDLRKVIVGKRTLSKQSSNKSKEDSDNYDSDMSKGATEGTPTVEAIVAVAKACREIKRLEVTRKPSLKAEDVFERDDNSPKLGKPVKIGVKTLKTNIGIKLSGTSETLIKNPSLSYDEKKKVFLEDGEVADSDGDKKATENAVKSSSSELDVNDLSSTGSIKDDDEGKKRKKEKHKKKKKEKKTKKRGRSDSRSTSLTPKKRQDSKDRRESRDRRRSRDGKDSRDCRRDDKRSRDRERRRSRSVEDGTDRLSVSRRRRSGSPSGRRRSRSPGWFASRRRSPSPRTRRRSKSPRRDRSRSPAYYQWRKRADMARDYRQRCGVRRSRTPVRERLGRRSRSSSLGIDKAALRAAAIKNTLEKQKKGKLEELGLTLSAAELSRIRSGASGDQKELTEFCRNLMSRPGEDNNSDEEPTQVPVTSDESEEEGELTENTGGIQINIKNAKPLPVLTPAERVAHTAALSKQFPVSSGTTHRKHESEWVPVEPKPPPPKPKPLPKPAQNMPKPKPELGSTLSGIAFSTTEHTDQPQTVASAAQELATEAVAEILQPVEPAASMVPAEQRIFPVQARPGNIADLVTQRLSAMKRAALNPNDVEAIAEIYEANKKIEEWTSSKMVPGQFLGSTDAKILTREELEGNKRNQCWAKKEQLKSAEPVKGLGMFLLEKMGWRQGMGLGKNNEGPTLPLAFDLKNDRKGLISNEEIVMKPSENNPRAKAKPIRDLSEKHPISALMELCQRRKWPSPNFIEVMESGPAHKRLFKFKVIVNGVEYEPTMGCRAKKAAKADAASVCLQALGLVPRLGNETSS